MSIKENKIWLIYGEEYLVYKKARELVEKFLAEDPTETELCTVDPVVMREDNYADILKDVIEKLLSASLVGRRRVIWLKSPDFLFDLHDRKVPSVIKEFIRIIERADKLENFLIVTVSGEVSVDTEVYKVFHEKAVIEYFPPLPSGKKGKMDVSLWCLKRFQELKIQIDPYVVERLIDMVGMDYRALDREIEKLAVFAGEGGTVNESCLYTMVQPRIGFLWELLDVFNTDNKKISINKIISIARNTDFMVIMETLYKHVLILKCLRYAVDNGWLKLRFDIQKVEWCIPEEKKEFFKFICGEDFNSYHPFRIYKLCEQASKFSDVVLKRLINILLEAHYRFVSSGVPDTSVHSERLLFRIINILNR